MAGKLTAKGVQAIKEAGSYQDGGGLALVVKPSGSRSWVLRVQTAGTRKAVGIGSAAVVSLAEARAKAADVRREMKAGLDVAAAKRAARAAVVVLPSFADAARLFHAEHKASWSNPKHAAQVLSTLESYAFPFIGETPARDVDGPAIRDLLAAIWLTKPETARRVRQRVVTVLDWAHAKGWRSAEVPLRSIAKGLPRQPRGVTHHPALPNAELPAFMGELRAKPPTMGRLCLEFAILTAARSGEARGARWSELEGLDGPSPLWRLPAERMKAKRPHAVPLSPQAVDVIRRAGALATSDVYLFPNGKGEPLSDMALTKLLRDAEARDAAGAIVTAHGFRSSFRDWVSEATTFPAEVAEAALAHAAGDKVVVAYARSDLLERRRPLMETWGCYCDGAEAAVVTFARRA